MGLIEDGHGAACVTGPESHWQQGCDDAKANKEPAIPFPLASGYLQNRQNEGYMNGWKFGRTRYVATPNEGSEP